MCCCLQSDAKKDSDGAGEGGGKLKSEAVESVFLAAVCVQTRTDSSRFTSPRAALKDLPGLSHLKNCRCGSYKLYSIGIDMYRSWYIMVDNRVGELLQHAHSQAFGKLVQISDSSTARKADQLSPS